MTATIEALRRRDYRQYLSLWLVPPLRRELAIALFDLQAELQSVPDKVKDPTLGLMRIVWWRDAVAAMSGNGAIRAHPLLQALQTQLAGMADTVNMAGAAAAWAETFDLPFLDTAERLPRMAERQALECLLLGPKAAVFLNGRQPRSTIRLGFEAIWLGMKP